MDVNRTSLWQRADARDWVLGDGAEHRAGAVRIASRSAEGAGVERDDVSAERGAPRATLDAAGGIAEVRTLGADDVLVATQEGFPDRELLRAPAGTIRDVAYSGDGVISVLTDGQLRVRDTHRYGEPGDGWILLDPVAHGLGPLAPTRVAAGPNGAWLLAGGRVTRWHGTILRPRPWVEHPPAAFRPDPEDPVTLWWRDVATVPGAVDLAVAPDGRAAVLTDAPAIHLFTAEGAAIGVLPLRGVLRPVSVTWASAERVAVLALPPTGLPTEAFVYPAVPGPQLPVGDFYPLPGIVAPQFLRSDLPAFRTAVGPRLLAPLSLPVRPTNTTATARPIDGRTTLAWHRLFVEADVPDGCGIRVELGASASATPPDAWYAHDLGAVPASSAARLVWVPRRCEVAGAVGWTGELLPGRAGLFEALIQRTGHPSSRLVGRYLHVRVTLYGDGRRTPALHAVRLHGPRFSYVEQYLPALYREDPVLEGDPGLGPSTPADFWERLVALFEGPMTGLEDAAVSAWLATHPNTVPVESLEWLAGWIGRAVDPNLPAPVRRALVAAGPALNQRRGTLAGLRLALDVVSQGAVTDGRIVVVEGWRLRRTFATLLGVDLADEADPLLDGLVVSGNSILGDTLVLGDEHHREFLALFGAQASITAADRAAVQAFFDAMAHRVLLLVQEDVGPATTGALHATLAAELPAHVQAEVRVATRAFVAGITALVGVDTRLDDAPAVPPTRLDRTRLGDGSRLQRSGGVHPDFEGDLP